MRAPAALLAVLLLATGCGGSSSEASAPGGDVELVVLAAASLSGTFAQLADRFEQDHPGTRVVVSTGASSTLAQQVVAGAPADVFAAASPAATEVVTEAGAADGPPVVFARNRLEIAVPPGNPGRVRGLDDLARSELDVAVCAAQVPCGAAATKAFAAAGVTPSVDTLEQDVKAVLAKVRLGEVDAGVVYVTDVRAARGEVEGVPVPEAAAAVNDYPAVVVRRSEHRELARQFVALLTSADGAAVLAAAGFVVPP